MTQKLPKLLIIDELGFEPMDRQEASLFFRLVTWALLAISLKLIWDASKGIGLIG